MYKNNSSYYQLSTCFILLGLLYLLESCGGHSQQPLTAVQKDSVLASKLSSYIAIHQSPMKATATKLATLRQQLAQQSPKELTTDSKIPLRFPICSGNFRDSCFFQSPHMAIIISKEQLERKPINNALYDLINLDGNGLIKTFWAIQDSSYRPFNASFKDTPFSAVERTMDNDFYNVQLYFSLKYLFVLDIISHTPPANEWGGGSLKAYYHIFDFQTTTYLGSLSIEAQNTPNFQAPTQTNKEVSKTQERTRYDGKRIITDRQTIKTYEKQSTSEATRYYYAKQDLIKNFKTNFRKQLNTFFCDEKGKELFI